MSEVNEAQDTSVESVPVTTDTPETPAVESTEQVQPGEAQASEQAQAFDYGQLNDKAVGEWNLTEDQIKSPEFQEHLESMRKGTMMQKDYTQKTQELAEQRNSLWDPTTRQFSDNDIQSLLNNQSFVTQANQMLQGQADTQQNVTEMTEDQLKIHEMGQKMQQQQQSIQQQQNYVYNQQYSAELQRLDSLHDGGVSKIKDQIEALRVGATNRATPLSVEGAYKAINYDTIVKQAKDREAKAFEAGKAEGMGIKHKKLGSQPINNQIQTSANVGPQKAKSFKQVSDLLRAEHA